MLKFLSLTLLFDLNNNINFVSAVDCTTLATCEACYNASYFCHWCAPSHKAVSSSKATPVNLLEQPATNDTSSASEVSPLLPPPSEEETALTATEKNQISVSSSSKPASTLAALIEKPSSSKKKRQLQAKSDFAVSAVHDEVKGSCHAIGTGCVLGISCDDGKANSTCFAQHSCKTCTTASRLCHWCGQSAGCHVLGSVYGCSVGVGCMDNTECQRKSPEYIGIGWGPKLMYYVAFGVFFALLSCALCTQCICFRVYKSAQRTRQEVEEMVSVLNPPAGGSAGAGAGAVDPAIAQSDLSQMPEAERRRTIQNHVRSREEIWARTMDRIIGGCFKNTSHFPRAPVVDYCNKETDWKSLIMNLETLISADNKVYGSFEFLLSVYNPNRVDIDIESIQGRLFYPPGSDNQIGTIEISDWSIPAGSISDGLAVIALSIERFSALNLARLYYEGKNSGQLKIGANASINFKANAYGYRVVESSINQDGLVINANAPQDRTYCNCRNDTMVDTDGKRWNEEGIRFKGSKRMDLPEIQFLESTHTNTTTSGNAVSAAASSTTTSTSEPSSETDSDSDQIPSSLNRMVHETIRKQVAAALEVQDKDGENVQQQIYI